MGRLVVSRHAIDALRRGHPWIYRSAVERAPRPEDGPHVVRIESDGGIEGAGLYDPDSPIAARVWSIGPDARLDADVFADRLRSAIDARRSMFADGATTAYRLLNGEGDRAPGFVLDRYDDVAVLRVDGDAAQALSSSLLVHLEEILRGIGITTLLERSRGRDRGEAEAPKVQIRFGPARDHVVVHEHGVPFTVDLLHGQKTGAFLDQRENRRRVGALVARRLAAGQPVRVLNLFSYTGGFSQRAALAGGAVTSVDIAAKAHATAQKSFALAKLELAKHAFVAADAFAWLAEAKRRGQRFDVVISDPPSFAPNERSKARAIGAYRQLHRACADVLAPGGHFVAASCSSHITAEDFVETLDDAALGRSDLRLQELHGPPPDHPTLPRFVEGRYLKLAILR
ncbi:MAG: class I SAM-dependent rRNA methyltransferase [Deltaproteobacteria bacterium]|nr:class I SAM-dependent rRNA methyltransferase [Deltaproteobacteria bacterium]